MSQDQLFLEQQMIEAGKDRYQRTQEAAHKRGDLNSVENQYFKAAIGECITALNEGLEEWKGKSGRKPSWVKPVVTIGASQAAAIALRHSFAAAISCRPFAALCVEIGRQIELEMLSKVLKDSDEDLYKAVVGRAMEHTRDSLRVQSFEQSIADIGMSRISDDDLIKIGGGVFNFIHQVTGFFEVTTEGTEGVMEQIFIGFTDDFSDALDEIADIEQWMKPVYRFMVAEPKPWTSMDTGCYYDHRLASTMKLCHTLNKTQERLIEAEIASKAPFVKAVNLIQRVPFRMNRFVVEMIDWAWTNGVPVKKFPKALHNIPVDVIPFNRKQLKQENRERRSNRAQFQTDLNEAKAFLGQEKIYEPAWLDWRSRVYAKPALNHQRSDYCKAMFEFYEGKPLDENGLKWLAIHLASTGDFEKMSKKSMADRLKWVRENTARICSMMEDPKADLWWLEADSPFCFLAACKAWADFMKYGDKYICHLPVAVDGSNSGLQHFSGLLRDPVGASLVCLSPDGKPADVYAKVAETVSQVCLEMPDDGMAQKWLELGINRSLLKTCVMTYVYGSAKYGFANHISDALEESEGKEIFGDDKYKRKAACSWLASLTWDAVQNTVKAAAEAMEWLQEVAGLLAKENKPVVWDTPMSFPVINAYYEPITTRVSLFLTGKSVDIPKRTLTPKVTTGFSKKILPKKQKSSVSPNFVHSLDSSHLMSVVLKANEEGIRNYLLIHDSFACLPSDMEVFSRVVREAFVDLYTNHDPLMDLYKQAMKDLSPEGQKKLKLPPAKGSFDINDVLKSEYAFA